jgi:hypothetical protein
MKKSKRIQKRKIHNNELYTLLTTDVLQELGFKNIGQSEFELYDNLHYWIKNGICLFYNTPVKTNYQESFLIGYAQMRQGKYIATTFKWINSEEQLTQIYEAIIGKKIDEPKAL